MKRVDFDPGERNPQNRGKSGYERISWDAALDLVVREIKRQKRVHGPGAITFPMLSHHQWDNVGYYLSALMRFAHPRRSQSVGGLVLGRHAPFRQFNVKTNVCLRHLRAAVATERAAVCWRFGENGEWTQSHMLEVQYHGITDAANLDTWRGMNYQTVLTPADEKTGDVIYPYAKAKQKVTEKSAMH